MNMKQQLTSIRKAKTKHFGYGTIFMTFFFKKIPALRPRVISTISSPRDPRIARWVDIMKRLGGSEVPWTTWDDEFFQWWREQIIVVDDYPYAEMDFRGDPDLVLPPGAAWGTVSKFAIFELYNFFCIFSNMYEKMENKHVFDWIHNDLQLKMIMIQILVQFDLRV